MVNTAKWITPQGFKTAITVYNSLTKTKVPLITKYPSYIAWYICGPTVYDSAHIGHASCYMKFDILRRIIESNFDIAVNVLMNVTNVDDKIINAAAAANEDFTVLSKRYEDEFFRDMSELNILPPTSVVSVTDFMPYIISFVKSLVDKGYGYTMSDGSVYFDTKKLKTYGKLRLLSELDDFENKDHVEKKNPRDFCLWKGAKPNEPSWETPWGKGRPGWHIECSAIASAYLGNNIDIHSGGIDLLFPHHENEEAQCCSFHEVHQWVNYWLHTGHLHLKGDQKMSKSLKNTIKISDLLESFTANEFRMFCLLSNYRNSQEFSNASMEKAKAICKKIEAFYRSCEAYVNGYNTNGVVYEGELLKILLESKTKINMYLADDFDVPNVISTILQLIAKVNKMLSENNSSDMEMRHNSGAISAACTFVKKYCEILGLSFTHNRVINFNEIGQTKKFKNILDNVVQFRNTVRQHAKIANNEEQTTVRNRNMTLLNACDSLRSSMKKEGIIIQDYNDASSWAYVESKKQ